MNVNETDSPEDPLDPVEAALAEKVGKLDLLLSHVWMVRAFIKHCEEVEEDDELMDVQRSLYDYMLALGPPLRAYNYQEYLKIAKKKLKKLVAATELYEEIQPEISSHTNFQMSAMSLKEAVRQVEEILTAS